MDSFFYWYFYVKNILKCSMKNKNIRLKNHMVFILELILITYIYKMLILLSLLSSASFDKKKVFNLIN